MGVKKIRLTTEEFIARAKAVHGDKYDYSKTVYTRSCDPVEVVCSEHGSFFPRANNHINLKSDCPHCKGCAPTTLETFLEKAKAVHGDKYDYSRVVYHGVQKKVEIFCPKHGPFWQLPMDHQKGRGCIPCGVAKCTSSTRLTKQQFINRAKEKHGDKYDYSQVQYQNTQSKLDIICPTHGPFQQVAAHHLSGNGCPQCGGVARVDRKEFIRRSTEAHAGKYTYGQFLGLSRKAEIICPVHGIYWQRAKEHMKGHGCPECAGLKKITKADFVRRSHVIHDDRYDYSNSIVTAAQAKTEIICREHGPFWQRPLDHYGLGQGCPHCAGKAPLTESDFLSRANAVHGDRYDLSRSVYVGLKEKIEVICRDHGSFWPTPFNFCRGSGCPTCANEKTTSQGEQELADWLGSLGIELQRNDRSILGSMEIDIYMPKLSIGVEYNGLFWHSIDKLPSPRIHEVKQWKCDQAGIQLITVWEHDWKLQKDSVKAHLLHRMGMSHDRRLHARSCDLQKVSAKQANQFYERHHIQQATGVSLQSYGLFSGDAMVACMSFGRGSARRGRAEPGEWELSRFTTAGIVRGGASRLFSAFIREHNPQVVWSYSDRQHFSGRLYPCLGFHEDGRIKADYRVITKSGKKVWHKSAWQRKNIPARLAELGIDDAFDPASDPRSERQMQDQAGVLRIMDSGKIRWKWTA